MTVEIEYADKVFTFDSIDELDDVKKSITQQYYEKREYWMAFDGYPHIDQTIASMDKEYINVMETIKNITAEMF